MNAKMLSNRQLLAAIRRPSNLVRLYLELEPLVAELASRFQAAVQEREAAEAAITRWLRGEAVDAPASRGVRVKAKGLTDRQLLVAVRRPSNLSRVFPDIEPLVAELARRFEALVQEREEAESRVRRWVRNEERCRIADLARDVRVKVA